MREQADRQYALLEVTQQGLYSHYPNHSNREVRGLFPQLGNQMQLKHGEFPHLRRLCMSHFHRKSSVAGKQRVARVSFNSSIGFSAYDRPHPPWTRRWTLTRKLRVASISGLTFTPKKCTIPKANDVTVLCNVLHSSTSTLQHWLVLHVRVSKFSPTQVASFTWPMATWLTSSCLDVVCSSSCHHCFDCRRWWSTPWA